MVRGHGAIGGIVGDLFSTENQRAVRALMPIRMNVRATDETDSPERMARRANWSWTAIGTRTQTFEVWAARGRPRRRGSEDGPRTADGTGIIGRDESYQLVSPRRYFRVRKSAARADESSARINADTDN
jgi:hypothetical protein